MLSLSLLSHLSLDAHLFPPSPFSPSSPSQVELKVVASFDELNAMTILRSRDVFKAVFDAFCASLGGPGISREQVEKNGGLSYQRVYDLWKKKEKGT